LVSPDNVRFMRAQIGAAVLLSWVALSLCAEGLDAASPPGLRHLLQALCVAALLLIMFWMMWWGMRCSDALVAPRLLRSEYCPSCGYSLAEVPPEPDGCSVCPECGAAWRRADRISGDRSAD